MDPSRRPAPGAIVPLDGRLPSEAVVLAVAQAAGVGPTDLPTLHDTIDPDALDALVQRCPTSTVTFEYDGYTVTVGATDEVIVQESALLDQP